ncbi:MAG: hypothetical protein GX233_04070 [Erysipelothrix sp.]|nr:hypothetical protein [Erysipelothrix sp.]
MKDINKKYFSLYFIAYSVIFLVIDHLNMPMRQFIDTYGIGFVIINTILSLTMAVLSAYLISLSHWMFKVHGFNPKGENLSFVAILFGILTYGCTPCVIAFFASIGISFSVMVLPLAGMPYKIISLVLILIGIYWANKESCKVRV